LYETSSLPLQTSLIPTTPHPQPPDTSTSRPQSAASPSQNIIPSNATNNVTSQSTQSNRVSQPLQCTLSTPSTPSIQPTSPSTQLSQLPQTTLSTQSVQSPHHKQAQVNPTQPHAITQSPFPQSDWPEVASKVIQTLNSAAEYDIEQSKIISSLTSFLRTSNALLSDLTGEEANALLQLFEKIKSAILSFLQRLKNISGPQFRQQKSDEIKKVVIILHLFIEKMKRPFEELQSKYERLSFISLPESLPLSLQPPSRSKSFSESILASSSPQTLQTPPRETTISTPSPSHSPNIITTNNSNEKETKQNAEDDFPPNPHTPITDRKFF
jgi:hypothetical protein